MNILHIGHISNRPQSGVSVVVPKHLEYQSHLANVNIALLNLVDFTPSNSPNNYPVFYKTTNIAQLEAPFNNPDLVIFHEIYRPPFIKICKDLQKRNIPYIIIPHGSLTKEAQRSKLIKKSIGNILFFNHFINNAATIHYLSQEEKERSAGRKNYEIVQGSGVDIHLSKKQKFSDNGLSLIYVGRLDFIIKGIDILLDAISTIKTEMVANNITVTIAGPGTKTDLDSIYSFIKKHEIGHLVNVEPAIFGSDKIKKILDHDCFIQLSRTEAQCLGLIEAMGLGLPCIATPGTTWYNTMKDEGIGIPVKGNPKAVAETILNVDKNKDSLHSISKKASSYIRKNYEWPTVSAKTIDLYRKVLKVAIR